MVTRAAPARRAAWSDKLIARLEALPVSIWTIIGAGIVLGILVVHVVEWVAGDLPFGRFDAFLATLPVYPFGILGMIVAQKRSSLAALERFRPASDMDEEAYQHARAALATQPPVTTLAATLAFGLLGMWIEMSKDGAAGRFEEFPVAFSFYMVTSFVGYMMAGPFLIGAVRLLGSIAKLHRDAPRVDLLNPEPVRAFSSTTAVVGASLIAVAMLSTATDPASLATPGGLALTITLPLVAFAAFVTPLWGMHIRLQAERAQMLTDIGTRIQATLARLYQHIDDDLPGVSELRDRLGALVAAQDLVRHQSTWPWRPETLRWLVSALVVPIVVWGVTRFLESRLV